MSDPPPPPFVNAPASPLRRVVMFMGIALAWVGALWWLTTTPNPLEKYGVSFEENRYGETRPEIQCWWRTEDGRLKKGPLLIADGLYIAFPDVDHDGIPEIRALSSTDKTYHATFRLNFTDRSKPEFELLENCNIAISYPPLGLYSP